jgi:hypothetical protein
VLAAAVLLLITLVIPVPRIQVAAVAAVQHLADRYKFLVTAAMAAQALSSFAIQILLLRLQQLDLQLLQLQVASESTCITALAPLGGANQNGLLRTIKLRQRCY